MIYTTSDKAAIVGWHEGRAGQVHEWLSNHGEIQIACFVNPSDVPPKVDQIARKRHVRSFSYPTDSSFKGLPLINSTDFPRYLKEMGIKEVLVTEEDMRVRANLLSVCLDAGLLLLTAIHPTAQLLELVEIGQNVIVHPGAIIGYKVVIEDGVFVNTGALIDHHSRLQSCCTIDPGCVLAGNVLVGSKAHLHTNCTVINRIEIGEESIVAAGAVVIDNVKPKSTVYGVPAKEK
jgi:serine O-acetyltransferase